MLLYPILYLIQNKYLLKLFIFSIKTHYILQLTETEMNYCSLGTYLTI